MNPIEPFGSSTYRKGPGKGIVATVRSSAVMKQVALLPRRIVGASDSFPPLAIKCEAPTISVL
jgi:hypothetical protein